MTQPQDEIETINWLDILVDDTISEADERDKQYQTNHYSTLKGTSLSVFLLGNLWVRFPTKIKMTAELPHKF